MRAGTVVACALLSAGLAGGCGTSRVALLPPSPAGPRAAPAESPPPVTGAPVPRGVTTVGRDASLLDREVDVACAGATLAAVLEDLGRKTGLRCAWERRANAGASFTMEASGVTGREVLRRLAEDCRLRVACQDGVVLAWREPDALARRLTDTPMWFEFVETPLEEVLHYFRVFMDADVVIDTREDWCPAPVTLMACGMDLGSALLWVLRDTGLEFEAADRTVYITHEDRLEGFVASGGEGGLRYVRGSHVDGPLSPAGRRELQGRLADADPLVRLRAVHSLAWRKTDEALGLLELASRDADDGVRRQALVMLAQIGRAKALPVLASAASDPDAEVRKAATRCLGLCGSREAVPLLAGALESPDEALRWRAVEALGRIGGEEARALVRKALSDAEPGVRREALRALAREGERALPLLERALSDGEVCDTAGAMLLRMGAPEAAAALRSAVEGGNVAARRGAALEAWRSAGGVPKLDILLEQVRIEDDADELWCAVEALLELFDGTVVRDALLERAAGPEPHDDFRHAVLGRLEEAFPGDPQVEAAIEAANGALETYE